MASAIRKLTGVGGDVRKIARLLQKKAPPGHMLAYINQEEADLLKARGGSGKPHADTGVPSYGYEEVDTPMPFMDTPWNSSPASSTPEQQAFRDIQAPTEHGAYLPTRLPTTYPSVYEPTFLPSELRQQYTLYGDRSYPSEAEIAAVGDRFKTPAELGFQPGGSYVPTIDAITGAASTIPTPREQGFYPGGSEKPTAENQTTITQDVKDWWSSLKPDTKARLGIGGIEAVIGAYQTNQAMEQARKAREDIAKVAQPYQEQGRKLIAQAQSGALTPAAQQTLQAAQAQAAQGAQARGGVGAQQAQAQVEGLRQQLLQQQYDYGLKVLGIGDQIAVGAIRAGMQADQYVNQLASSYANNIARTVAGTPTYVNPFAPTNT